MTNELESAARNAVEAAQRADGSPAGAARCRVWIVEDHVSVRQLLASFIDMIPGFAVVGSSADGRSAVEASARGEVDLVTLDLNIAGEGGLNTLQHLRLRPGGPRVVIYSATVTVHSLQLAMARGAQGYVDKGASLEELKTALINVKGDGFYFSEGPSRLLTSVMRMGNSRVASFDDIELRVFDLLLRGFSPAEISRSQGLSISKVYRIRLALFERTGVSTIHELILYGGKVGLTGAADEEVPGVAAKAHAEG